MTDIHAVLEVNVLDEDKNKVVEFLGKVEIPIIQVSQRANSQFRNKGGSMLVNPFFNRSKMASEGSMPSKTRSWCDEPKVLLS